MSRTVQKRACSLRKEYSAMDFAIARARTAAFLVGSLAWGAFLPLSAGADTTHSSNMVRLSSNVASGLPGEAFSSHVTSTQTIKLAVSLNLRNEADLEQVIHRIYDPKDSMYHHYLKPADLTATYSPTQADYDAVKSYLASQGLTVTGNDDPNRLLIHVQGAASVVENAFNITLNKYTSTAGRTYMRPSASPEVSSDIADKICRINGLNSSNLYHTHIARRTPSAHDLQETIEASTGESDVSHATTPTTTVTPTKGYGPADIRAAYNIPSTLTGSGQTIGLYELDGYVASDVTYYTTAFSSYFGASYTPSVTFESVDSFNGTPSASGDAVEVILDIEVALAMAPAANIKVYCADQTATTTTSDLAAIDVLAAMYADTTLNAISTSWGIAEFLDDQMSAEHHYYALFEAEGIPFFAASGDDGCYAAYQYGYETKVCVDYPSSDPYITGVGGTTLYTSSYKPVDHDVTYPITDAAGSYLSEGTWNNGAASGDGATGGGISSSSGPGTTSGWAIPDYQSQSGVVGSASLGSLTWRNVPDVSLNADSYSGYAIYDAASVGGTAGVWKLYGGTSAAAPLWAAFTTLVNQKRAAEGLVNLGFMNPILYHLALTSDYASDFHDIADGVTNGYYPSVAGYDLATGLGSFNGANLISTLAPPVVSNVSYTPDPTYHWSFFTLPYDYTYDLISSTYWTSIFGSATSGKWYDDTVQVYTYTNASSSSVWGTATSSSPGYGYWAQFSGDATTTEPANRVSTTALYPIALNTPIGSNAAWTAIGNPFTSTVGVANIKVEYNLTEYSMSDAVAAGLIAADASGNILWYWNPTTSAYSTATATGNLYPYYGYWIATFVSGVTLEISPS